jgi:hypothetical protein
MPADEVVTGVEARLGEEVTIRVADALGERDAVQVGAGRNVWPNTHLSGISTVEEE